MAIGFVVTIILLRRRSAYEQLDVNFVLNCCILCVFGTIVGGRAVFVLTTWEERFAANWVDVFKVWEGGLVFYGGFFGSILFVSLYSLLKRQQILRLFDLFSPYVGLGLAIHRPLGCFMNGCCYGAPTSMPWGVHFPVEAFATKVYGVTQTLHPTQIYMGINGLFLFFLLRWYRQRKKRHGEVFALLLMVYAVDRFIIELFRGDDIRGFVGRFSTSQLIGLGTFLAGALIFLYARKWGRPVQPEFGRIAEDAAAAPGPEFSSAH